MSDRLGPYLLGPNEENWGIYEGDSRVLAERIPDEGVDLIFTDPIYENVEDYRWLASAADRVLKPNSACLVWLSYENLPAVVNAMCPPLKYVWILSWHRHTMRIRRWRSLIKVKTPCLWLEKGTRNGYKVIADVHSTGNTSKSDKGHQWSKPFPTVKKWVEAFTKEDMVVWDPFVGHGGVPVACSVANRRWLAFEIDADAVRTSRKHVRSTQFLPHPESGRLF